MDNDYEMVARCLDPTQAHVLRGLLRAGGIAAEVADDQLVQTNFLWAPALGGARVLVPGADVAAAKEVIAAFERGEFALGDDEP